MPTPRTPPFFVFDTPLNLDNNTFIQYNTTFIYFILLLYNIIYLMTKSCKNYRPPRTRGRKRTLKRTLKRTRTLRGGQTSTWYGSNPIKNYYNSQNFNETDGAKGGRKRTRIQKRRRTLRGGQDADSDDVWIQLRR